MCLNAATYEEVAGAGNQRSGNEHDKAKYYQATEGLHGYEIAYDRSECVEEAHHEKEVWSPRIITNSPHKFLAAQFGLHLPST